METGGHRCGGRAGDREGDTDQDGDRDGAGVGMGLGMGLGMGTGIEVIILERAGEWDREGNKSGKPSVVWLRGGGISQEPINTAGCYETPAGFAQHAGAQFGVQL